jgi:nitrite reductase/ring-hydroxylating ferredoxin subunit
MSVSNSTRLPEPSWLERNPELAEAATYERTIGASLERVWENVRDWEHLPWLHNVAFSDIELLDGGDWGWRARVTFANGTARSEIALCIDAEANRYVTRTLDGVSAGSEIWTTLSPSAEHATDIRVDFLAPPLEPSALRNLGAAYLKLYEQLWDEDEAMMQERERALARRAEAQRGPHRIELGELAELRKRLPLIFEIDDRRFRLVELGGKLIAHSAVCPHRLGPLVEPGDRDSRVTCPWHGYAFDIATNRSCDGRSLRLAAAAEIRVDAATGSVSASIGSDGGAA